MSRDTLRYPWIVLLILIGQALLLTFRLADQSMWTDEMFTARIVHSPTLEEALAQIRLTENRPPLYYLALWVWARIIGYSEWGMRFFSVAAILLATAVAFRLAHDLISRRTALLAALLIATAPTLLWHGRMIRGYAPAVPLAQLSTLTLWRAWRSPRLPPKLVYLVASSMLLFTDYLTVPVVGVHALFLGAAWLFRPRRRAAQRQRMLSWLVVAIGLLLAIVGLGLTAQWQGGGAAASNRVSNLFPSFSLPDNLPRRIPTMVAAAVFVLYSFGVGEAIFPWHPLAVPGALAVVSLGYLGLREMWRHRREAALLTTLSIVVPLGFVSLIIYGTLLGLSTLVIAAARNLYLGPLCLIPLGASLSTRHDRRTLLLAVLLAARCVSLLNQTSGRHFLNPVHEVPVRELAAQVARNVQPGDMVVFEEPLPFDVYFRQIDATTPLFTPGPHHIGHVMGDEIPTGSHAFLGKEQSFIPAIAPDRLVAYLQESRPPRLWLVVFHHEGDEHTVETEIGQSLVQNGLYQLASRIGYAAQDPIYARLRAWLRPRTPIHYKAEILLYVQGNSQTSSPQSTPSY
jgi:4-amino-4-deoxy-L-arabinose transferase-like glycosyltransferase